MDSILAWYASASGEMITRAAILAIIVAVGLMIRFRGARLLRRRHHASTPPWRSAARQQPRWHGWRDWFVPAAILITLLAALAALYQPGVELFMPKRQIAGWVTNVRDGDTIEVERQPIRLNGLNCDERGTPLGEQANFAMRALVSGQTLHCTLDGDRTYDRQVGRCALADGRDIGAVLIARRLCGRCARYDPRRSYAAVQREAGPFQGNNPPYCWAPW